jgi:hypothetical protein
MGSGYDDTAFQRPPPIPQSFSFATVERQLSVEEGGGAKWNPIRRWSMPIQMSFR